MRRLPSCYISEREIGLLTYQAIFNIYKVLPNQVPTLGKIWFHGININSWYYKGCTHMRRAITNDSSSVFLLLVMSNETSMLHSVKDLSSQSLTVTFKQVLLLSTTILHYTLCISGTVMMTSFPEIGSLTVNWKLTSSNAWQNHT